MKEAVALILWASVVVIMFVLVKVVRYQQVIMTEMVQMHKETSDLYYKFSGIEKINTVDFIPN